MEIRMLTQADVSAFWELRLQALLVNPEAFGSSYEESVDRPLEAVRERFHESPEAFMIGAFNEEQQLIAMAGFRRETALKIRHRGEIWGVFTRPDQRGKGAMKLVMLEIITRAKKLTGLQKINLAVVSTNEPAKRLYRSLGFQTYGVEERALKVGDHYYDEDMMVLFLQ